MDEIRLITTDHDGRNYDQQTVSLDDAVTRALFFLSNDGGWATIEIYMDNVLTARLNVEGR